MTPQTQPVILFLMFAMYFCQDIPMWNQNLVRSSTAQPTTRNRNTNRNANKSTGLSAPKPSNIPCGRGRKCVPSYICLNGTLNTGGASLIDLRMDNTCPYSETCCAIEPDIENLQLTESKIDIVPSTCGYRNIDGVGVGVGVMGEQKDVETAKFGEFPWMIAILLEEIFQGQATYTQMCGGSLITPEITLTSAHCVKTRPIESFIVRAGEWEFNSVAEGIPHQDRRIFEIVVHPEFKRVRNYNDIAILFLEAAFNLEPNVNTVCLPPAEMNFDFARCYAAGWRQDKNVDNLILKKVYLPVVPHSQCQENFRTTHLGTNFVLHSSFLCAGGEGGKDTCKGDGGSPLVCPIKGEKNRYYQAGIVSWGIGCGQENLPGAYASLPWLRTWIDEILIAKGFNSTYYTP